MKTTRRTLAGLVAASLLAVGTSGCIRVWSWDGIEEADAPMRQALLDATKVLDQGNFAFTITDGSQNSAGVVDLASNSAAVKTLFDVDGGSGTLDLITVDENLWVRIDYGDELNKAAGIDAWSDKYLLVDQTRVPDLLDPPRDSDDPDPASAAALLQTAARMSEIGSGDYRGYVNLSKVTDSMLVDEEIREALGGATTSIPFRARIDEEGRLVELTISTPAAGEFEARSTKIVYNQFGSAIPPRRPTAAQSMPAPETAYELLTD
ncbi:hypothetical protein AB0M79_34600 [Polymorphospora sp. NPDC051019]|uniref:hypothetical protein n=1 Tax=Polymorphospora sp. NPDC051019 TaxID=3155725 RepID=UPI003416D51C